MQNVVAPTLSKNEFEERITAVSHSALEIGLELLNPFEGVLASRHANNLIRPVRRTGMATSEAKRGMLWPAVCRSIRELWLVREFETVRKVASAAGMGGSIGLVVGGTVSFVLGLEGMVGAITDVDGSGIYSHESLGVSVGTQEGLEVGAGLFVSTEKPSELGFEWFAKVAIDAGVGVSLAAFTKWNLEFAGLILMITTGEELAAAVGGGQSWTQQIC